MGASNISELPPRKLINIIRSVKVLTLNNGIVSLWLEIRSYHETLLELQHFKKKLLAILVKR